MQECLFCSLIVLVIVKLCSLPVDVLDWFPGPLALGGELPSASDKLPPRGMGIATVDPLSMSST